MLSKPRGGEIGTVEAEVGLVDHIYQSQLRNLRGLGRVWQGDRGVEVLRGGAWRKFVVPEG